MLATCVRLLCLLALLAMPLLAQKPAGGRPTVLRVDADTVTILRDGYGVPHVFASTERGLFYGNGYAVAQDRMWQLERYRRDALGTLAEIEGKPALAHDREVRRRGYTAAELAGMFAALEPAHRALFQAYADGINAYMEQAAAGRALPQEYARLGLRPAPWDPLDSVAIAVMMSQRFGSFGGEELRNLRVLRALRRRFGDAGAWRIFNDLFWRNDPKAPATIGNDDMPKPPAGKSGGGRGVESERDLFDEEYSDPILARAERRFQMRNVIEYAAAHRLPTTLGSYAWVIGARRSASGNPILVGGPQMGWMTPQIAHEIHLSGAGYNVIGMGFAGVPGVLIGFNNDVAWTTTSGLSDVVDTFEEKLHPRDPHQYQFRRRMRPMNCRVEVIQVRGGASEKLEICRTIHGPVMEWDKEAGVAFSLAASYAGHELETVKAILGFNRARNVAEFAKLASCIWLSHNFLAADRAGNIGYWHGGRYPVRPFKYDDRLPLPGTGEAEWKGFAPFENNPQAINPSSGYLANWNNKPAPWFDATESPVWGEIFRVSRIQKLIEEQPKHTAETMRQVMVDIAADDANAAFFRPRILAAVERASITSPDIAMAAGYLRAWSGRSEEESAGKTIFDAWLGALREVLFRETLGSVLDGELFDELLQPSFMLHVLDGSRAGIPPRYDYLNGRTADQAVLQALSEAMAALKKKSPGMQDWAYHGPMNTDFQPLPAVPRENRGTYIQIVEMGETPRGISILAPGQSEDPRSPHYSDQLLLSSWWKFKPMLRDRQLLQPPPATSPSPQSP